MDVVVVLLLILLTLGPVVLIWLAGDRRSEKERQDEAVATMKKGLSDAGMSQQDIERLPWPGRRRK